MKDGVFMQIIYVEDETVTNHYVKVPKHIVPEILPTLHGKTNKHPGIAKKIQECKTMYYYPKQARSIGARVNNWPKCIVNKRIDLIA